MRQPPPLLAPLTLAAGGVLLLVSAGLQVAILNASEDADDDLLLFLSVVVQGLATAAGLAIAAGVVLGAWWFVTAERAPGRRAR